jgi:hypothetical protein
MDARRLSFALAIFSTLLAGAAHCDLGMAQEFRIETTVYIGDAEEPASRSVTLFEKSAVYEFLENPEQIFVYREVSDEHPAQFILLDPATQRRTEIDVDRVAKLMEKLTSWAAEQDDKLVKFSAKPAFTESYDAESGSLTLANPEWTYRVATVAADDRAALQRYRTYIDHYTQLTTMLHSAPPPGPRLALNAALFNRGAVPVEIRRTIAGDEKNVARAEHLFSWRLSRADRNRLDEAQKNLASYTKVENEAFIAARVKQDAVRGQSK